MNNLAFSKIWILMALVILIGGAFLIYQYGWMPEQTKEKKSMWEESFNTLVNGYAVLEQVELDLILDPPPGYLPIKKVWIYFKITGYTNDEFIKNLEKIIEEGNSVNTMDNGSILFNLGCLEDGEIITDGKGEGLDYIDEKTKKAILNSTKENPIKIILYFEPEPAGGCRCCSFANKVRIY